MWLIGILIITIFCAFIHRDGFNSFMLWVMSVFGWTFIYLVTWIAVAAEGGIS